MLRMAAPELNLATEPARTMDRRIDRKKYSAAHWPLGVKVGFAAAAFALAALLTVKFIAGAGTRTLRLPLGQVTFAEVNRGMFHDLIPLRANVVPRETVYVDAIDGGRVDRVLVEAGDMIQEGQPIVVLSNTNLALQVIQQESQLNQAISQLQQNEIALEQNQLSNDRALADIDYNLVRLGRSAERREGLAAKGVVPLEQRDIVTDELAYYQRLRPIQAESRRHQSDLRDRLLPDIHEQLKILRGNLAVVNEKLDSLVVRAPVAGRITALDLKVGETRGAGQRLAEVTPQTGMKLIADVDEFYLARVRLGQTATITLDGAPINLTVQRISPQVRNGQFRVDFAFDVPSPAVLVEGAAAQGHLQLGGDSPAVVLPTGPFLDRSGGDWVFVVGSDGRSAERRQIKAGRRTNEQLEILSGLKVGEQVITSDYTGLDKVDRVVLTR
jgi:HlyD family secretion protein